jgi:hypothetical protein
MMSHIDCWSTLAAMTGLTPPPHGPWTGDDGKPIYFDNSAYILGKERHSARRLGIYIDGESFMGARGHGRRSGQSRSQHRVEVPVDGQGHLARAEQNLGAIGSVYNLTMDPFQRPDNPVPFLDLRNPPRVKSGGG